MRLQAVRIAPTRILAYNARLERHHLRVRTWIASFLFLSGVPLDRIWLRPSWLFPWKRDRTKPISYSETHEGRPFREGHKRVAVLSPYFPYPLSHGGAVRIYNLLRYASREFDIVLFAFAEKASCANGTSVLDFCSKVIVFPNPYYREPRWSTVLPPEVKEYSSPYVKRCLEEIRRRYALALMQVEYTQLASYGGDVLVEHDVTFDLYDQVRRRAQSIGARWNWWRWRRYEPRAAQRFRRVVVMSDKDARLIAPSDACVIPNGVDLQRFQPLPERPGACLLFVGSFRHFPNVDAFKFFLKSIWPLLAESSESIRLTVIAGPDPHLYYDDPLPDPRIEIHAFVSDVRPFYAEANVVIVPTQVSAGTNLKVLEAMAMERPVVSTSSGCAGLGLTHEESVLIADSAPDFAAAIERLLCDVTLRRQLANNARRIAERKYDWQRLSSLQTRVWHEVSAGARIRVGEEVDLPALDRIQKASHAASQWEPRTYFEFDVLIAEKDGQARAFLVSRRTSPDEIEVLNLAVEPDYRRQGLASCLILALPLEDVSLEVRESNLPARKLYEKLGFLVIGRREEYYDEPIETALVMRLSRNSERATF